MTAGDALCQLPLCTKIGHKRKLLDALHSSACASGS